MFHVISDVHGNVGKAIELCEKRPLNVKEVVFLGDIGFGFSEFDEVKFIDYLKNNRNVNYHLIQGNHDNAEKMLPHFYGNINTITTIEGAETYNIYHNSCLLIPGALSYDKHLRVPGVSWWENEQMSQMQWESVLFKSLDVNYIFSHDAPLSQYFKFFPETKPSLSNRSLDELMKKRMWSRLNVKWIHGHLHYAYVETINSIQITGLDLDSCMTVY